MFSATCAAQPAVVERPDVKVGDSWTYRRIDYDNASQPRRESTMRVVFADRGVIQVVITQRSREQETDTTFTADWNAVTAAGRVINPHTGWFKFPLHVGDRYKASFDVVLLKKQAGSRNDSEVKVVGWEEVIVPAGTFRALKIISEGRWRRTDGFGSGTTRNVIWYVPEIKRWAKLTFENRPAGQAGSGEHWGDELLAYQVQ